MKLALALVLILVTPCRAQLPVALSQITGLGAAVGHSIVFGTLYWGPGVAGISCTITAQISVICVHNLNSSGVRSWIWDSSGYLVRPARKQNTNANSTTITFDSAFTGIIVIK